MANRYTQWEQLTEEVAKDVASVRRGGCGFLILHPGCTGILSGTASYLCTASRCNCSGICEIWNPEDVPLDQRKVPKELPD